MNRRYLTFIVGISVRFGACEGIRLAQPPEASAFTVFGLGAEFPKVLGCTLPSIMESARTDYRQLIVKMSPS